MNILVFLFLPIISMAAPTLLEGTWQQRCLNGTQREELFQEEKVTLTERAHEDSLCSSISLEFISEGTFILGQKLSQPLRATEIDFEFEKISVVLYADNLVEKFNKEGMCGFSDWEKEQKKEITGIACSFYGAKFPVPQKGEKRFGVYLLEGKHLFFGQLTPDRDARTPDKRPLEYNPYGFMKQ